MLGKKEPVLFGSLITGAVNAVLLVLSAFNVVSLDGTQTAAVYTAVNVVVLAIVAIKTRSIVWAPDTADAAYGQFEGKPVALPAPKP